MLRDLAVAYNLEIYFDARSAQVYIRLTSSYKASQLQINPTNDHNSDYFLI